MKITAMKKTIDPVSFQPILELQICFNLEMMQDASVQRHKDDLERLVGHELIKAIEEFNETHQG